MSTEKPVSDPLEPEGTGVPADAAAEHTTSGSKSTDSAETPAAETEPVGDTAAAESSDADATEKVQKPDPDATVKVGKPDSGDKAGPSAEDETVVLSEASAASTGAVGKTAAGTEKTVKLDKAGSNEPAVPGMEETVELNKSGATAGAGDEKSASGDDAGKSSRSGSRFPLPVVAGAAVLLIAALVAVGVFFFLAGDRQDELDRRAAATKAACDFGNSFATYTGDKADDYVQRLDQGATGEWKELVSQIGPDLKARFAETQVNSTAADVQCGYESGSDDQARVVLVIDQQFTTVGGPQQQAPGRVKVAANVDLERVDGAWLVANFDTPMMQQ